MSAACDEIREAVSVGVMPDREEPRASVWRAQSGNRTVIAQQLLKVLALGIRMWRQQAAQAQRIGLSGAAVKPHGCDRPQTPLLPPSHATASV